MHRALPGGQLPDETRERYERREALLRALAKAAARVKRRVEAVRGDLLRAQAAGATANHARLFVAEAAGAPRGADRLVALDWSSGRAVEVEMPLDPARGAREQVEATFKLARRLKDGATVASARLNESEQSHAKLTELLATATADPDGDLDAIAQLARDAAPREFKMAASAPSASGPARRDLPRPPYRAFLGASGARILVGRGAAHNDALTLHVARPRDLWLHAKGHTGAHVIVPLDKGASCPADVLVEAAHLAAHFSEAREERVVEVQYTPRRYVRKPRRSAPGLVVVDREKVILLRREDATLKGLLAREVVE
jgi:predicted ribosome quality control (RQC) complex YloA/Tae2 family protein